MVSRKLKLFFLLSIPLFILHGSEEYLTGFYNIDSFSKFVFHYSEGMSVMQATFLTFQFVWWLLLIVVAFVLLRKNWQLYLMTLFGIVFIFELHHIVKAVINLGYYPGLITGLLFPVIGFFYWKELTRNWRKNYDRS